MRVFILTIDDISVRIVVITGGLNNRQMSNKKKALSIKHTVVIVLGTVMLTFSLIIFTLLITRWDRSAEYTSREIAESVARHSSEKITSFLRNPLKINEENHKIIENGILSLSDQIPREKFFLGILDSQEEQIYSFSIGTVTGEYYGARRNTEGILEIMRNNASTGGHSWYYSVKEDLTAGEIAVKLRLFDPRTRAWYTSALEADGPAFSPVYQHFVMNDLTISAAIPVRQAGTGELIGVMGTHMLLGSVSDLLAQEMEEYNGYSFIIDKENGELIANSMGLKNFTIGADDTSKRLSLTDIEHPAIQDIAEKYSSGGPSFTTSPHDIKDSLFVSVKEISLPGIDWILLTAVPEHILYDTVHESITLSGYLIAIAVLLAGVIYYAISQRLWRPLDNLLNVTGALSNGDLDRRATIVRNDEIGSISEGVNQVADNMQYLINNLERIVEERTETLNLTNKELEESRTELETLLDSTAEGIFGIDLDGNCTFLNKAALRLLGYEAQEQLLGENMHRLIHHHEDEETECTPETCPIISSVRTGKGYDSDNNVFYTSEGNRIDVSFHSYPRIIDGKIVGGVITFLDITQKKERENQIEYLSSHDTLTGLFNRSSLEFFYAEFSTERHLPLSVIFGDLNGLKMTNDVFGHLAGDSLLAGAARILTESIRKVDVAARIGGDEFLILLPNTGKNEVREVIRRIKQGFEGKRLDAVNYSMALGSATRQSVKGSIETLIAVAEEEMYKDKARSKKDTDTATIATILETLSQKKDNNWNRSDQAQELCDRFGKQLNLTSVDIRKLKKALTYHDIGMITLDTQLLRAKELKQEEQTALYMHPITGYRILSLYDDMLDIAEIIYAQHEHWDGSGIPRGLEEEQIPPISRAIAIIELYYVLNHARASGHENAEKQIRNALREKSGTIFDPDMLEAFMKVIELFPG